MQFVLPSNNFFIKKATKCQPTRYLQNIFEPVKEPKFSMTQVWGQGVVDKILKEKCILTNLKSCILHCVSHKLKLFSFGKFFQKYFMF